MTDESLPPPTGATLLPPPPLSPEQQDLCKRLDDLYDQQKIDEKPSKMFQGAIFAIRPECQSNPDRIAQAAHSLREILYPFKNIGPLLKKYGSVLADDAIMEKVGRIYGQLNDLAHHGRQSTNPDFSNFTTSKFERLLDEFVKIMQQVLTRQLDIHKQIDQITSRDPAQSISDDPTA